MRELLIGELRINCFCIDIKEFITEYNLSYTHNSIGSHEQLVRQTHTRKC